VLSYEPQLIACATQLQLCPDRKKPNCDDAEKVTAAARRPLLLRLPPLLLLLLPLLLPLLPLPSPLLVPLTRPLLRRLWLARPARRRALTVRRWTP